MPHRVIKHAEKTMLNANLVYPACGLTNAGIAVVLKRSPTWKGVTRVVCCSIVYAFTGLGN